MLVYDAKVRLAYHCLAALHKCRIEVLVQIGLWGVDVGRWSRHLFSWCLKSVISLWKWKLANILIRRVRQINTRGIYSLILPWARKFRALLKHVPLGWESCAHGVIQAEITEWLFLFILARSWECGVPLLLNFVYIDFLHIISPNAERVLLVGSHSPRPEGVLDLILERWWAWFCLLLLLGTVVVKSLGHPIETFAAWLLAVELGLHLVRHIVVQGLLRRKSLSLAKTVELLGGRCV